MLHHNRIRFKAGHMTKDLAMLTGSGSWLTTRQLLARIRESLDWKLAAQDMAPD